MTAGGCGTGGPVLAVAAECVAYGGEAGLAPSGGRGAALPSVAGAGVPPSFRGDGPTGTGTQRPVFASHCHAASAGKCRSLGGFPITVPFVGPTARMAGNTGLSVVVPVHYQPTGRQRHRPTEPSCAARQAVGTDTNLHDALSVS
jgi:hypothetical protein